MSDGGESAYTHCSTGMAGMLVEPRQHPVIQHTTTWEEDEAHPVSFHSSYLSAPASGSVAGFINLNNSGTENMNLYVAPVNASTPSGLHIVPLTASLPSGWNPINKVCNKLNRCGKKVDDATRKAEALVDNVWHHLKTSHSVTDAAIARLAQGKKMLLEGGRDKVFEHAFGILPGEKLLKTYACYLSTSSGLFIGTLYLSTKRLVFHGDEPLCHVTPSGQQEWVDHKRNLHGKGPSFTWVYYYTEPCIILILSKHEHLDVALRACEKVVLLLDQLSFVSRSSKGLDHSEKYIQVVTRDGHEFWFKGFVSYDKALKNINEALQQNRENSTDGRIQVRSVAGRGK